MLLFSYKVIMANGGSYNCVGEVALEQEERFYLIMIKEKVEVFTLMTNYTKK